MSVVPPGTIGVFLGAILLGFVHGVEPGHGWPVAASYALARPNKWLSGIAAGLVLGGGHLISSLAVVAAFFLAKEYFELARFTEPVTVVGIQLGGPIGVVAGLLLLWLGVREYRHWRSRDDGSDQSHGHSHGHGGDHGHAEVDVAAGGDDHDGAILGEVPERGLVGLAGFAFALGFVHEEEFEIIGLCLGSTYCLELMLVYALAVLITLVALTLLLIAGYYRYEERVERYVDVLPTISAVVLVAIGVGFILGLA